MSENQVIDEAITTSQSRVTKEAKMARLSGGMAMQIAKAKNDPMYARYQKARKIMLDTKKKIQQKYGQKGKMAAREAARGRK